MAQVDIPRAGRLNPRTRRANGVGDTVENLGFPELDTAGISPAGKLEVKRLILVRKSLVANSNIVLKQGQNFNVAKVNVESYLERTSIIYENFQKTAADIADGNANGIAVMEELIALEDEIESLNEYCIVQIANQPAAGAAAGADQIRLSRLEFPTFDGETNYRNWKAGFNTLIAYVHHEDVKRCHLRGALKGDAKVYIDSVITPNSTYADIMAKLEARYNDPMVVNNNLLDKMFNSPEMAKPKSTLAHWDTAVGEINAILESGMAMSEVLVYFKLHKFQLETVKKVKLLHKIRFPGKPNINLEEAIALMNQVTAEEVALKKDSVAIEQTMQGLTMTAVPTVSQAINPASIP